MRAKAKLDLILIRSAADSEVVKRRSFGLITRNQLLQALCDLADLIVCQSLPRNALFLIDVLADRALVPVLAAPERMDASELHSGTSTQVIARQSPAEPSNDLFDVFATKPAPPQGELEFSGLGPGFDALGWIDHSTMLRERSRPGKGNLYCPAPVLP
jgi:hypothetical protein